MCFERVRDVRHKSTRPEKSTKKNKQNLVNGKADLLFTFIVCRCLNYGEKHVLRFCNRANSEWLCRIKSIVGRFQCYIFVCLFARLFLISDETRCEQ